MGSEVTFGTKTETVAETKTTTGDAEIQRWIPEGIDPETAKAVSRYKSLSDLIKGKVEQDKLISRGLIKIPDETATEEDLKEFYAKIGRPDKPEDYELKWKTKGEDGKEIELDLSEANPNLASLIRTLSHKAGVPQNRIQSVLEGIAEYEKVAPERNKQELVETWGGEKSATFKKNSALYDDAWESLPEDLQKRIVTQAGPFNPLIAEVLVHFWQRGGSPSKPNGKETVSYAQDTYADLERKIVEKMGNPSDKDNPYWNNRHADHAKVLNEVLQLNERQAKLKR